MKSGQRILMRDEAEAIERVLSYVLEDQQKYESTPQESPILRDLEKAAQGLCRAEPTFRQIEGGRLSMTRGVRERTHAAEIYRALGRHLSGDWGEVCAEDWQANEEALQVGARLFSVYASSDGERFWIITEADRSSTCVLLPDEY